MYSFEIICVGDRIGIFAVLSHLISDAWTFSLIINEIEEVYEHLKAGNVVQEEKADYIKYVLEEKEYVMSLKYEKDAIYWKEKYSDNFEKTDIKPGVGAASSIKANRVIRKLPMDLACKMKEYCRKKNFTEAVFLETVLNMYLFKINPENSKVTIGIPVLNRTKTFEKRTAGMFISTLPLTINMAENNTIKQVMEDITKAHIQVFRHQKYPYSLILKEVREKQEVGGNLYNVMFSFQNARLDIEGETEWYSNGYM